MSSFEYTEKYYSRFIKKSEAKPAPVRLIMERTFHTAVWVLETIEGVDTNELNSATNLFISNLKNREFATIYGTQLEIAWTNVDKFIFGLHSFYNNLARKVKKEHKEQSIADFISEIMRYQVNDSKSVYNKTVTAYINMILQTLEYLRPDKFDLEKSVYGIDDDGKFLLGPCPFPYSDVPMIRLNQMMLKKQGVLSRDEVSAYLMKEYQKQGIEVSSIAEFSKFECTQRIHVTTIASMISLISADTYDMLPEKSYGAEDDPIRDLFVPVKVAPLCEILKRKQGRIPRSGIAFVFDDRDELLERLVLKEIVRDGKAYILYRLCTVFGDLSGYYDFEDYYFYSVYGEAEDKHNYEMVRGLVLSLYASQVFSNFLPLNQIALRMSGPISIEISNNKEQVIMEENSDNQLSVIGRGDGDLKMAGSVQRKTDSQGTDTYDFDAADSLTDDLPDTIYPFTWYQMSKS